jgi:hypothetical protein
LLAHTTAGTEADASLVERFARWLRYTEGGHPLILQRLASAGRIPREIRFYGRTMDPPGRTVTLRVERADTVPESALSLDGHRRSVRTEGTAPIDAFLERVTLGEVPDPEEVLARRKAEALAALEAGRLLECALTLLELTLETEAVPPDLGGFLRQTPDAQVRRLLAAMSPPQSEAESRARIATFLELREPAGPRAHVLMTFESGCRLGLGEDAAAFELLVAALQVNPFLALAYKDAGDRCAREYDMRRAWACWEAARKIAPGHSSLEAIAELEKMLAAEHPDYF